MARPIKDGMDYFSHDTDAAGDEKIESLMLAHGPVGYTFYFVLLERIYRTPNGELNISEAETRQILARKMFITQQEFDSILPTAIKTGCFCEASYTQNGVLTSEGIKKRYQTINHKRLKNRTKIVSAAETKQKHGNNPSETPESKVKESKVKERKAVNKTSLPADFKVSERVKLWAKEKGHSHLDEHLESFKLKAMAKKYTYVDWDAAFMGAIRDNWAKIKDDNLKAKNAAGQELKYV
jgi:hypothetical protein